MKSVRNLFFGTIFGVGLIIGLHLLHAQQIAASLQVVTATQPAAGDSIVRLVADQEGLELVPPDALPKVGTFFLMMPNGFSAPFPMPPPGSFPTYGLGGNEFLVDGSGGMVALTPWRHGRSAGATTVEDALALQAQTVLDLIDMIQSAQLRQVLSASSMKLSGMTKMDASGVPSPGGGDSGGGGGDTNSYGIGGFCFDTNGLWLDITNVSGGMAFVNLHNATNAGGVYEIFTKTNLLQASWNIAGEVFPTDTNCNPFTVAARPGGDPPCLFVWARDWTGVTSLGNQTPEWWFWKYFGTTNLSDNGLDTSFNTLLYDYTNHQAPDNVTQFTIAVANTYVSGSSPQVGLNVMAGTPACYAVLVDGTNFSNANWVTFSGTNIAVNLGVVPGWHDVWIGLRGFPTNAAQTWQWKHMNLSFGPVLTITNPSTAVVDEPTIQIYGYCQEALASISYNISNAVVIASNLPSEITDQYYDTNAFGLTTNYFECLDVPLTNGLNVVTIHATDFAGNAVTTNFNFTLDYSSKTNPPLVQITWPQDGTQISGNIFTCRGWVGDPTASVITQLVFTNSDTNLFWGGIYTNMYVASVERNGNFWLENLPIGPGTNQFAIRVMDAVGNTTTTNISLVQSTLALAINPVTPDSQLWQATVNLTGTISDPTYAVWVNGVKGHNNGNGSWSANNVPVSDGGTASFTATAYAPNEQQPDGSYGN